MAKPKTKNQVKKKLYCLLSEMKTLAACLSITELGSERRQTLQDKFDRAKLVKVKLETQMKELYG